MNDTICAISTPAGVGGIAVARVSGPDAISITAKLWRGRPLADAPGYTVRFGEILDTDGEPLDQAVATIFRAPRSFTGEDTVEISVHGSAYIQSRLINALIAAGARLAQPGEFTRRAFASGKIDLAEAEAVADVIAAQSKAAHALALGQMKGKVSSRLSQLRDKLLEMASLLELELDFSEEDVEFASRSTLRALAADIASEIKRLHASFSTGNAIKNGIPVAIVGATNVGKSSLLNRLLDDDRAIVSDIHGTTRDIVEDTTTIGSYLVRFIDTAGIRDTDDTIESLGIERSFSAIARARVVILVIDASAPLPHDIAETAAANMQPSAKLIIAINKTDIVPADEARTALQPIVDNLADHNGIDTHIVEISAATGAGLDILRNLIVDVVAPDANASDVIITNARHAAALEQARESIAAVIAGLDANLSGDFIAQDLRLTLHHLAVITGGEITTPEILATIFQRFCIGK